MLVEIETVFKVLAFPIRTILGQHVNTDGGHWFYCLLAYSYWETRVNTFRSEYSVFHQRKWYLLCLYQLRKWTQSLHLRVYLPGSQRALESRWRQWKMSPSGKGKDFPWGYLWDFRLGAGGEPGLRRQTEKPEDDGAFGFFPQMLTYKQRHEGDHAEDLDHGQRLANSGESTEI